MHTPPVDLFDIENTNRDSIWHAGEDAIKGTPDDILLPSRFNIDPVHIPAGQEIDAPESYGFASQRLPDAQARGISTLPGGIPLYKEGSLVGGIGVFFPGPDGYATHEQGFVAGVGQTELARTNAPQVLEAEWIAFAAAGGSSAAGATVGELEGVPPLAGAVLPAIRGDLDFPGIAFDHAQISICYPGYPKPWDGETDAAFRFRRDRDAAHVDGLIRSDPGRRRSLGETHAFILGLPLTEVPKDAAPFVVYEGSHRIMRRALAERLAGVPPHLWGREDITEAYVAARRLCFETCPRVAVHARPGQAYLAHRLALHGVAPWGPGGGTAARMVAYFRPDPYPGEDPFWWLERP